jgi:hypothetical protein
LVQKFNAKLGGVNQLVTLMRALTSPSARSDTFMFFGDMVKAIAAVSILLFVSYIFL